MKLSQKIIIILISLIPNAILIKSMLAFLPDLTVVFYAILYATVLLRIFHRSNRFPLSRLIVIFSFVWIFFSLITLFYTPNFSFGAVKVMKLSIMGIGLSIIVSMFITEKKDFDYFFTCFLRTSFMLQVCVIVNFVLNGMPVGRFVFFGVHPIPLSMLGAMSAIVGLSLYTFKKITTFNFLLSLSTSFFVIAVSSTKGPLLAAFIAFVLFIPTFFNSFRKGVSLSIVLAVVFYFVSKTDQYKLIFNRIVSMSVDQSTYDRLNIYRNAISIFKDNPIFGGGFGILGDNYPHNIFLEVLSDGGIVMGMLLVLFYLFVAFSYINYVKFYKSNMYVQSSLAILLISSMVLLVSYTYVDLKYLYVGAGLLVSSKKLVRIET